MIRGAKRRIERRLCARLLPLLLSRYLSNYCNIDHLGRFKFQVEFPYDLKCTLDACDLDSSGNDSHKGFYTALSFTLEDFYMVHCAVSSISSSLD